MLVSVINHEQRLLNILNFMNIICIEGGCGCDIKEIMEKLAYGIYNYEDALEEWCERGWKRF